MAKIPDRSPQKWPDFLNEENNIPAVLEYKNAANGFHAGARCQTWDVEGVFFAVHDFRGNAVWSHQKNFDVLSIGTMDLKEQYPDVPCVENYSDLIANWQDMVILHLDGATEASDEKDVVNRLSVGTSVLLNAWDDGVEALRLVLEFFPNHFQINMPQLEKIQWSNRLGVPPRQLMTISSLRDVFLIMTAVFKNPAYRHPDPGFMELRSKAIFTEVMSQNPSETLIADHGVALKGAITQLTKRYHPDRSFGYLLPLVQGAVSGITNNNQRKISAQSSVMGSEKHRKIETKNESTTVCRLK